jgi:phosphomannomutase
MTPQFGTSGLRGLAIELTPQLVGRYVAAFAGACDLGAGLFVGRDLRASSPDISASVITAARALGIGVTDCGVLPTPALAMAAMTAGAAAIMVTGSHIPADRNGLKFYLPTGEITKSDEGAITAALPQAPAKALLGPYHSDNGAAIAAYIARYKRAYGADALAGLRLGVYQHSSAARDVLMQLLGQLGALPTALGRSDHFIPIDTEALEPDIRADLALWAQDYGLHAILSTDGDGDRPLLVTHLGDVIAGDLLGVLTATALGATALCTPVSANSMIGQTCGFGQVMRCKIGSPHVIAAMHKLQHESPNALVAGFEPNGGFLLGFDAHGPAGVLPQLMTRDAFLPMIAPLVAAKAQGRSLAAMVAALPARAAGAERITPAPTQLSAAVLQMLDSNPQALGQFLGHLGAPLAIDKTDGLRMTLAQDRVLHLRPSGNAPEFRIYAEAATLADLQELLAYAKAAVATALDAQAQTTQTKGASI